ncbi:MAG: hypothetical protein V4721_00395 [Bacteroidota bacterium]
MTNNQAAINEMHRIRKIIALKRRDLDRWRKPEARDTTVGKYELKRLRRDIRELEQRLVALGEV